MINKIIKKIDPKSAVRASEVATLAKKLDPASVVRESDKITPIYKSATPIKKIKQMPARDSMPMKAKRTLPVPKGKITTRLA